MFNFITNIHSLLQIPHMAKCSGVQYIYIFGKEIQTDQLTSHATRVNYVAKFNNLCDTQECMLPTKVTDPGRKYHKHEPGHMYVFHH